MVEIAISMPILIFLMIGVFEVGSALRSYLVLVNVNREITRFAVRPGYLDFSTEETIDTSYQRVRDWVFTSNTAQLDLDFDDTNGSSTLIISHVVADTGVPCEDTDNDGQIDCDCDDFEDPSFADPFPQDNIIIHPGLEGMAYQAHSFGPTTTSTGDRTTRIHYDVLADELVRQNNQFNCEVLKRGGVASANNVIVTELFHDQPQLFGFPLISNPFTDPVPLYTHTVMRLIGASRSSGSIHGNLTQNISSLGPFCMAYPLTAPQSIIDSLSINTPVDILGGAGPSDWGWLSWNPGENDENYLNDELAYQQMSMNDYTNPNEAGDHTLNVGDYVKSFNGTVNSSDTRALMEALVGQEIIIPIWNDYSADGFVKLDNPNAPPPKVDSYLISSFVKVRIDFADNIDIPHKTITATYLGPAEDCMPVSP
ncbi:MAG: pilus assembly protein [Anaerolineae bacterium]|nr:pilus assembly protein [Anaerolineae bacterium]